MPLHRCLRGRGRRPGAKSDLRPRATASRLTIIPGIILAELRPLRARGGSPAGLPSDLAAPSSKRLVECSALNGRVDLTVCVCPLGGFSPRRHGAEAAAAARTPAACPAPPAQRTQFRQNSGKKARGFTLGGRGHAAPCVRESRLPTSLWRDGFEAGRWKQGRGGRGPGRGQTEEARSQARARPRGGRGRQL